MDPSPWGTKTFILNNHMSFILFQFASNVASNKELRDASNEAKKKLGELGIDMSLRKDVFENIKDGEIEEQ